MTDWVTGCFIVHRVDAITGNIYTFAGNFFLDEYSGDGHPATNAGLSFPIGIAIDAAGNVFIADSDNYAVRKVTVPSEK